MEYNDENTRRGRMPNKKHLMERNSVAEREDGERVNKKAEVSQDCNDDKHSTLKEKKL